MRTGRLNLPGSRNAREETVRMLRASGLRFEGGLLPHHEQRLQSAQDLMVPRMHKHALTRRLRHAQMCVAPWGNHVLADELLEGLACRCLVLAQSIRDCSIVDAGLQPGTHYVEVAADLSNLVELTRYYLAHQDEAQHIADAGHEHFQQRLASRGPLVSPWIFDACLASWGPWVQPGAARGWSPALRAFSARMGRRY
jgi:hypothetical protein